ncbi:16S rRNA (cytosine(1402)-N(4))-methyltransferase RsmH [Candidatus Contubernalis alkaliaceticus]|uniref:16S rRNA (cytosine(1402)-N(4))-methyltransferase RsmH n=1 Tax=Candidatus Contubernalis alkaliaceticus TaxID=338645 RepID=UPI001F4C3F6E|nr:16S rRNA (cytosine(1402)-N(4))-methyltransferase RsmH [Candidatus Contubernalis alkalaceticus]UNC92881.1 16S rRNA (cytosine(1402)-N(4))-methyltransferase RsmH [Candidatus Contubernalis alkalaceticus]
MHVPVLLKEVIEHLNCETGKKFLDCTLGQGGHSREILEAVGPGGFLWGLDQDQRALDNAKKNLSPYSNFKLIQGSFKDLSQIAQDEGINALDGILFDLGISSAQLDSLERGFTYQQEAPLDMRMDLSQKTTAQDLVNELSERELVEIIKNFGEELWARRIAKFIIRERKEKRIKTTGQMVDIIKAAIPARARRKGGHPARRTFQALRIAVNQELESLSRGLEASISILKPKGRLCVISFHSLEDKIVKKFFGDKSRGCVCPPQMPICNCAQKPELKIVNRKPILPEPEEIQVNPRSRSAKLRVGEKIDESSKKRGR